MSGAQAKLTELPPELLTEIFVFAAVDGHDRNSCVNLAVTCKRLYEVGIELIRKKMATLRSFSDVLHLQKLHQEKEISKQLLLSFLEYVTEIDVDSDSQSSLLHVIDAHRAIHDEGHADEINLFSSLQLLTLELCATHISESYAEHLLLPLLSEEVMSIDVAVQGNTCTIPMHSLYSCIAKQAPKLEKLLLPNSSSAGLSTNRFPYLNTLTLQDLQGEDASAIALLSRLRDLTISCQRCTPLISTEDNTAMRAPRMPIGTFPDLENLDLIASNIQALEGLLTVLPLLMTPKSCSFEIRHSDQRWDQMLKLLETCISPSKLINLELALYRKSDGAEHHDWIARGLSTNYLAYFLPYTHLRRLYFSARIKEFFIKMTDEDIKQLAMNGPKLVEIVLEGCPSQESSKITLSALMYLAQHLDFEGAPLTLQIPLAAINRPSLADFQVTRLATRNVDLTLPSDRLPIQSSAEYVFNYLKNVMPRIRSLQFGEASGTQESWTSVAGRIYDRACPERWPNQNIKEYL